MNQNERHLGVDVAEPVATRQIERPDRNTATRFLVLGREVRFPKYGKGYVTEIEDNTVTVRFWKSVLRPVAALTIAASFFAMLGHYLAFGPKTPKDGAPGPSGGPETGGEPR